MDKAIITCAITGVLTDPKQHPVPVTVEQMAASCKQAYDAGAAIVHLHFRRQEPGLGHLPTWDPDVCAAICDAVRSACPGIIINMSTGVIGPSIDEPAAAMRRIKPEIAACNAGTLNYLKTRSDGAWAWPPLVFDNPVAKVKQFLDVMNEVGARPEFECFDTGIVRSVGLYVENGMAEHPHYNFVMGVASGMAADVDLLPLLRKYTVKDATWEVTAIGRAEVWPLHQRAAELGGSLRTGLEDTFYLPDGARAQSNGQLIEAIAECARRAGRGIASPEEARVALHLRAA
ncbi:MAG TPA: 3-keto-5-aminohexanoate cleavage protein [Nannocystaceae bacterium]|nr:3-keto-5-aminohexanoate cleavage protein [Nannocystaceae bacterium]